MIPILEEKWVKISLIFIIIFIVVFITINIFYNNKKIDFCGDNICSEEETCRLCSTDCGCNAGRICSNDICIFGYEPKTKFKECFNDFSELFNSKEYQKALLIIPECRLMAYEEIENIKNLKPLTEEEKQVLEIQELRYKSDEAYLNYKYNAINNLYLKYSGKKNINYIELINDLKNDSLLLSLDKSLYYSYKIKSKYPDYYDKNLKNYYKSAITEYEQNSEFLNYIYNSFNDYNYKYFLQIEPLNPAIEEISNSLIKDLNGNESKIKESLINFVRLNVKYKQIPNWQNSYVNPPVLTLVKGYGECTDMSVLLASLFINSGIKNVNLCFADTKGYGIDHLVVGVKDNNKFEIWDATCSDCKGSAPETSKYWKLDCFDINEYIKKPLQRCYDNTPYNECSLFKGFYCDQGNLIPKCGSCSCPNDAICYNNKCYKCQEGATFVDGECVI